MKVPLSIISLALLLLLPTQANAASSCRSSGAKHHLGLKEINIDVYATPGSKCIHNVKPCKGCAVLSVNVVSSPRSGTLRRLAGNRVEYRPRAAGEDNYTLRWCERKSKDECYLARYRAHVD